MNAALLTGHALLTPAQAREALAISERHLRKLIKSGKIPFVNIGGGDARPTYRFRQEDLNFFINTRLAVCPKSKASTDAAAKGRGNMTLSFELIDFAARRRERAKARPKLGSKPSAKPKRPK